MFASATENFVKNVDSDGNLIPVSSLNNCGKLNPLSLVLKQSLFFRKTKYTPTKFTLDDVLTKNPPLNPAVKECDFVGYGGTFGDSQDASVDVETKLAAYAVDLNFNMGAKHASTLKSSLGKLKKEEVDVKWLQNISKDKLLDMSLSLIQDARKNSSVFGVVMERIVTSEPCSIREKKHQAGNVGAGGNVTGVPVSVKGKVEVHGVKDVFLEIPKNTVIAYSIEEIKVKLDGHFEVCSSGKGGFEPAWFRSTNKSLVVSLQEESILHQELEKLSGHFQVLSSLPTAKRSSLLQLLKTTMEDREAVSVLENVLDQMLVGETPDMDDLMEETEKQIVQAILELLHKSDESNEGQTDDESPSLLCSTNLIEGQTDDESPSLLCSINLIVSAMNEMTDEGLSVLGSCCSPPVLQALQILVHHVAAWSGETLSLRDAGLAVLTEEEVFGRTESLFGHSEVTLKREEDTLRTEMKDQPGYLPLVMSITVKGLASLV
ncbi:gasdermin-E-like isoform X1 [Salvelinus fontinalis]|uniref:gasdermin-E-like isoform X1 n=1 Tax=Salvelinus fontinalis TaxID=8038 RepID=UPI0024855052|nr:gasdermin-E-like isoform X1 [Salvelinus fontinalis]